MIKWLMEFPRRLRHDWLYWQFCNDCNRRGLSGGERHEEWLFRHSFVRLRRLATVATIQDPENFRQHISAIAAHEANWLKLMNKTLARRFLGVVEKLPDSDILYPEGMDAIMKDVRRFLKSQPRYPVTDDDLAALRTI